MQTWTAELLHKTELILGEGALWHPGWKKFLYVDIEGKKLGCIDPVTKIAEEKKVDRRIGTVVPATNGHLIIALQGSIEEFNFKTGERKKLTDIETDKPDNRCNDGKCDAKGRLWIGTMHVEAKKGEGALYCYDGRLQKKLNGTSVSNGICWNKENTVMYYIDSYAYNIRSYQFDPESGNISNEKIVAAIKQQACVPDGMCMDEEGMLWVAIWGGGCINRYNPFTGKLIGKVTVGVPNVTACAFGGKDRQQLLITTARAGLNKGQLQQYPISGSLFIVNIGICGLLPNFFAYHN